MILYQRAARTKFTNDYFSVVYIVHLTSTYNKVHLQFAMRVNVDNLLTKDRTNRSRIDSSDSVEYNLCSSRRKYCISRRIPFLAYPYLREKRHIDI